MSFTSKYPAAQVAPAKKAAALKTASASTALNTSLIEANEEHVVASGLAAETDHHQHDRQRVHGPRAPPVRLLDKNEILAITGVSYPTIWLWMRQGKFPRSRVIGGDGGKSSNKSIWRSDEVEAWIAALPVRALKGDPPSEPV
jgi:predicted DNA-binding transcriptional regulator AlpA